MNVTVWPTLAGLGETETVTPKLSAFTANGKATEIIKTLKIRTVVKPPFKILFFMMLFVILFKTNKILLVIC